MVKRIIFTFITLSILILTGCNSTGDYNGFIEEVKESSIIISPHIEEHEGDYPVYEIFLNADTKFEGNKVNIEELERGDNVIIWVEKQEPEKEIATRILVED